MQAKWLGFLFHLKGPADPVNGDPRVLVRAFEEKDCCSPENCGGCKSETTCSHPNLIAGHTPPAISDGLCEWRPASAEGRVVGERCNCVGGGPLHYGAISQHVDAYPDYAACHAACLATEGCHFFGPTTNNSLVKTLISC